MGECGSRDCDISLAGKTVLVTGAAGFIGAALIQRIFASMASDSVQCIFASDVSVDSDESVASVSCGGTLRVVGFDNLSPYYDVELKRARLRSIEQVAIKCGAVVAPSVPDASLTAEADAQYPVPDALLTAEADAQYPPVPDAPSTPETPCAPAAEWVFIEGDIARREELEQVFRKYRPAIVVNLAAQAGVRQSISDPDSCFRSNTIGFYNVLELCRHYGVEHLVYASSSSVYGSPSGASLYSVEDRTDSPVSLYAATKKGNELMAFAYSKLYGIPSTGLRFFTVYGPAGRPDMAYFSFAETWRRGGKVRVFNYGRLSRDFTYIDDIAAGVLRVLCHPPQLHVGEDGLPLAPARLYNIGNGRPVQMMDFLSVLSSELVGAGVLPPDFSLEAHCEFVPMQPGDVLRTCADTAPLERDFAFRPQTDLRSGLSAFARWYAGYCIDNK